MDTNELKFILKLLGCANYRSNLSASNFSSFKGKDKICRDLGDRGLVDYSREVAHVKILPSGQGLLDIDPSQLPITQKELQVLEKISKASGKLTPSEIKISSVKATEKEAILKILSDRGLIEAENKMKKTKAEVWLTERGIEYLRDDYNPNKGSSPVISLELLNNYIRFLRKNLSIKPEQTSKPVTHESHAQIATNFTDEEIFQTIQELDRELGTENYLPIFHLRQKLQPLSRDQLDKALYRLQATDQIELSSLQESNAYSREQVEAGISQNIGSPLFFIIVN